MSDTIVTVPDNVIQTWATEGSWTWNSAIKNPDRIYEINYERVRKPRDIVKLLMLGFTVGMVDIRLYTENHIAIKLARKLVKKGILTEVVQEPVGSSPLNSTL